MKNFLIATGMLAAATTGALAQDNANNQDDAALADAKVTLAQAVAAAEAKGNGKVSSADFEKDDKTGIAYYSVEIIGADGEEQAFAVDASSGDVTVAQASDDDHNGEGGENGEDSN